MIAWLRGEQGADVVDRILLDPSHRCLAHSINLCEVYYDAYRHGGELTAHSALQDLECAGKRMLMNAGSTVKPVIDIDKEPGS